MSRDLERKDSHLAQPEGSDSTELAVDPNRVVVYGSRLSGALDLARELGRYLEERGVSQPQVVGWRDAGYLRQAFFDEPLPHEVIDGPISLPSGKVTDAPVRTLPRGVVVFPEMRQYTEMGGMFLDTYESKDFYGKSTFDHIRELCERHGVPYLRMDYGATQEQLIEGLKALDAPKDSSE